jgi:hypothetical protein
MTGTERARAAARGRMTLPKAAKAGLLAFAVIAASPVVAAGSEPVRIGVLDVKADKPTHKVPGVEVVYREFSMPGDKAGRSMGNSGYDHGQIVLTAAVDEVRRIDPSVAIRVYSANAFREISLKNGSKGLRMNFEKAAEAIEWMHGQGVRVVVTAFNTRNVEGSKLIMDKAESLGMTLFAGASNDRGMGKVLPAADARAVSVADTTPGKSSLTMDVTVDDWVRFGINGSLSLSGAPNGSDEFGSSFASAKAGAYGAYYQSRNPEAKPPEIIDALARNAPVKRYLAGSRAVHMATLGDGAMPVTFRRYVDSVVARNVSTPTQAATVAVASIDESPALAAMQMAARGGASR